MMSISDLAHSFIASMASIALCQVATAQICGSGGCHVVHQTPGCSVVACCEEVCMFAPNCCLTEWDEVCVSFAEAACVQMGVCGLATAGNCFAIHSNPACSDESCCSQVCAADPPCCTVQWDSLCVQRALVLCGSPSSCPNATGPCDQPHPQGGCSDQACCEVICELDPHCCLEAWDAVCVAAANCFCFGGCNVICPANSLQELEVCGVKKNDPCYNPGASIQGQSIIPGFPMCARLFVETVAGGGTNADVDVFVAQLGLEGSGQITATLSLNSKRLAWAALVPAPPIGGCNPLALAVVHVHSQNTVVQSLSVCVPSGKYWVVASSGTFPFIGEAPVLDCADGRYLVTVNYVTGCVAPCGDPALPCFLPHIQPGCGNPAGCCQLVCDLDPYCCLAEWDNPCAISASAICGAIPPVNDACVDAIQIQPGATPFTTILATADGPPLPAGCNEGAGLSFDNDVWYRFSPTFAGAVQVSTCQDASFDTRLAIYQGTDCSNPLFVACNDDDFGCAVSITSSTVEFNAACGASYLIRLGGRQGASGVGTLLVTELGSTACGCAADLNDDGIVNGADLGVLLSNWNAFGGPGDLDGSGFVDGADLGLLLATWGPC